MNDEQHQTFAIPFIAVAVSVTIAVVTLMRQMPPEEMTLASASWARAGRGLVGRAVIGLCIRKLVPLEDVVAGRDALRDRIEHRIELPASERIDRIGKRGNQEGDLGPLRKAASRSASNLSAVVSRGFWAKKLATRSGTASCSR
jgi:hypothetical protein